MPVPRSDRVLNVVDLLDRPGASRRLDLSMGVPQDLGMTLVDVSEPLSLVGVVESVVDGLLVRGRVSATVRTGCARCLVDLDLVVACDVIELFCDPGRSDADDALEAGYEIREGSLDLDTLLRDALVPAVPYQPLCSPACQGLCGSCGANLNQADCGCVDLVTDPRWAALEGLRLADDAS
ncbi:MAG TPA: DUF177 domain-containing protein [Egibacteraceae bacterium]|nr:DUF177 domain-containing protein [Actinomycetota bacterium]HWB71831.1 DUF177 domain-containing protein [Egibacteraceae bacterium]